MIVIPQEQVEDITDIDYNKFEQDLPTITE